MKKSIFIPVLVCSLTALAQTHLEKIDNTLNIREVKSQIDFLASDEMRGRDTGSPEIDLAARYLVTQLSAYGARPIGDSYFQEVAFNDRSRPEKTTLTMQNKTSEDLVILEGTDMQHDGKAVFLGYGTEEDFKKGKVSGKLVIARGGYHTNPPPDEILTGSKTKRILALQYGAAGLIELLPVPAGLWGALKGYFGTERRKTLVRGDDDQFVNGWMYDENGDLLAGLKEKKAFNASLTVSGIDAKTIVSKNVVAVLEGSDPELKDQYIAYTAHYDHIGVGPPNDEGDSIFNGARDNAIGIATILSAAKSIGTHPTRRSGLFVFFTAEEKGLLGSEYYAANPPIPFDQITYCLNSDGAGYNDKSAATMIGADKTTATDLIESSLKEAGLNLIKDPMPEQNLYERSDQLHFAKAGVPSTNISMGVFGFNEEIIKYYHNVADNPNDLDYEYLKTYFRAYLNVVRSLANSDETFFWTEGDKYYDAGVKLYNKTQED